MSPDADVVGSLLMLEQALSFAYRHVPRSTPLVAEFARQEREHARILEVAARKLGVAPPQSGGEEALAKLRLPKSIGDVHSETEALDLLLELEDVAVGAYFVAVKQLAD